MIVGRILLVFFLLVLANPAQAWLHGSFSSPPSGFAQINVSSGDFAGGFLNAINTANQLTFIGATSPSILDANGFPAAVISGTDAVQTNLQFLDAQTGTSTTWLFKWTPAGNAVYFLNGGWSNIVSSGCSISSSFTTTITMTAATPCRVTFTWASNPGNNLLTMFKAATYAAGSPPIILSRLTDETAIAASIQFGGTGTPYTLEYLNSWANVKTVRFMPWIMNGNANLSNQSDWGSRTLVTNFGWNNVRFPLGKWSGNTTGTNQYTVTPGSGISLSAPVDGEVIQFDVANASTTNTSITGAVSSNGTTNCPGVASGLVCLTVGATSALTTNQQVYISGVNGTVESAGIQTVTVIDGTHIALQGVTFVNAYTGGLGAVGVQTLTITGKAGGDKLIANDGGIAFNATFSSGLNTGNGTFVYNGVLGIWLWSVDGITSAPPIEAMVALSNSLNANFWFTFPMYANDNYVTQAASLVRDNLKSALTGYFEYLNETWNTGFRQFAFVYNLGTVLGMPSNPMHSYTGLRARQIFGLVKTAWIVNGRLATTLRRALMWQAYGDITTQTYRMNGGLLDPANNKALCLYLGGTFSGTCSGAPNYSTAGNRPIDFADVGGYATYFSGANVANFSGVLGAGGSYSTANAAFLNTIATLYSTGVGSDLTTALALIDNDIRQGSTNTQSVTLSSNTFTASGTNFTNNQMVIGTTTGSFFTGLSLNTPYFVVNVSGSTFKLAATYNGTTLTGISGGSGVQSFGVLGGDDQQTLLNLSSYIYRNVLGLPNNPGWEGVIAGYDSARAGFTPAIAPLRVELYEGGMEIVAPLTATCLTIGVSSPPLGGGTSTAANAATNIAALIEIYKNNTSPNYGSAIALSQFKQFMGTDLISATSGLMLHSKTPSWFLLLGPSPWSLYQGMIGSTSYQTFNGVSSFVGQQNFLLKRDIDPSSNDNSPMWLEKAA